MSDRPVDVLTAEEEAELRRRHRNETTYAYTGSGYRADAPGPDTFTVEVCRCELGSGCRVASLLATLDAARSATPSSEEDERESLAAHALTIHRNQGFSAGHGLAGIDVCEHPFCVSLRPFLATPDGAGRSPIDVEGGIVQRSHVACSHCWCGEHHEEGR